MSRQLIARKKLPKHLKVQVLARDGYRCRMCGRTSEEVELHVDHVRALSDGGTDELDNLATLCRDCNLGKAAYRFRDYREMHVSPPAIPVDRASLFAYTNAHSRPAAIAQRIARKRNLEFANIDGDCVSLLARVERLDIPTIRELDNTVARHANLVEQLSDYLVPKQALDADFAISRALEIEAMERNGLDGLTALLSNLQFTSVSAGWMAEVF
jgi:hypothetical protein